MNTKRDLKTRGKLAFSVARDAKTGRFVSVKDARRHPATTKIEERARSASAQSVAIIRRVETKYDKALKRLAKR